MEQPNSKQPKQASWQDKFYLNAAKSRSLAYLVTNFLYLLLIGIVLLTTYSAYNDQEMFAFFTEHRAWFGRIALLVLLLVITPGILGRFNIQIRITRIITLYRRRLGILVFMTAFVHYHLVSFPKLLGIEPFILPLFQVIGSLALVILFVMFLTSNNFSQKKLGVWWKRLHRLVYVALLLVLLHTAMQRLSIWSILAGVFLGLEFASLLYAKLKGGSFFDNPVLKGGNK